MKKQKFLISFLLCAVMLFVFTSDAFAAVIAANVPQGTVGKYYSAFFSALGASDWSCDEYSLPRDLSFNDTGNSASITGYPKEAGIFGVTVYASGTDFLGRSFSIQHFQTCFYHNQRG